MSLEVSVLASGSSGNTIYVASERIKLLIDAGLSGREITRRLNKIGVKGDEIDGIFISHEHIDHVKGAGVLSRRFNIPLFTREATWAAAEKDIGKVEQANQVIVNNGLELGDLQVKTFSVPHDAADPCGFIIEKKGKRVAIATDMGWVTDEVKEAVRGANILILESNHDLELLKTGPYPPALKRRILGKMGHLSNDDAGACITEVIGDNHPRILLAHLSKDNNIPELAFVTVKNTLESKGFFLQKDLDLYHTYRDKVTGMLRTG